MTTQSDYADVAQRAVDHHKGQAKLARALGYEDVRNIAPWVRGERPFPPQQCVAIEQSTEGAVTRKDLRPDDWHLIWPELAEPKALENGNA